MKEGKIRLLPFIFVCSVVPLLLFSSLFISLEITFPISPSSSFSSPAFQPPVDPNRRPEAKHCGTRTKPSDTQTSYMVNATK